MATNDFSRVTGCDTPKVIHYCERIIVLNGWMRRATTHRHTAIVACIGVGAAAGSDRPQVMD